LRERGENRQIIYFGFCQVHLRFKLTYLKGGEGGGVLRILIRRQGNGRKVGMSYRRREDK